MAVATERRAVKRVRRRAASAPPPAAEPEWLADIRAAFLPREPEPILAWLETNVRFSGKTSAVTGYWNHASFPYSKEPLEALADPAVREVVANWATQLGKTSLLNGFVSWTASQDPQPILLAFPDENSAKEHRETKLIPFLEQVEDLAPRVPPKAKRKKTSVDLGESIIYYAWSGARWTVSGRSAATVLITEVNLHTRAKSGEGDPVEMARDRTKAFPTSKVYVEGKPTVEGDCRVTAAYDQTDRRTYHVPCPHCGEFQPLEFGSKESAHGLKWEKDANGDPLDTSVHYVCRACKGRIDEGHKTLMLLRGVWSPDGQTVAKDGALVGSPKRDGRRRGYHLSSLYSPLVSWAEFVRRWLAAKRESVEALKAFVQSWLAEPWKQKAVRVGEDDLARHKAGYKMGELPAPALAIICTVDVQEAGYWYVVRAWGYRGSSWLVWYGYRLRRKNDLDGLAEILAQPVRGPSGEDYRINTCWIDAAYDTSTVYDWCDAHPGCVPVRGEHQYNQLALVAPSSARGPNKPLLKIDAGQAFDELYDRRLAIPMREPGAWAIPDDIGHEYLRSLASWERKPMERKGAQARPGAAKYLWASKSKEHEHLADCEKVNAAAAFHYRLPLAVEPAGQAEQRRQERPPAQAAGSQRRDGRGWFDR